MGARKEFRSITQRLLERGIITRSSSDWASSVVLVRKKDGSSRSGIDYRTLNKVTKQDSYPLPAMYTVIQSLKGKKVFSTLDDDDTGIGKFNCQILQNEKRVRSLQARVSSSSRSLRLASVLAQLGFNV